MSLKSITLALTMMFLINFEVIAATNSHLSLSSVQLRATAPGMSNSAAYVQITNQGSTPDRLITAKIEIAKRVEIHSMEMDNGVMRMRPVVGGLPIPAGETVKLAPGGLHIMLMGLTGHLAVGSQHEIVFAFEIAGEIRVEATVKGADDIVFAPTGHEISKHSQ